MSGEKTAAAHDVRRPQIVNHRIGGRQLVVISGPPNCGKSAAARELQAFHEREGRRVVLIDEPEPDQVIETKGADVVISTRQIGRAAE